MQSGKVPRVFIPAVNYTCPKVFSSWVSKLKCTQLGLFRHKLQKYFVLGLQELFKVSESLLNICGGVGDGVSLL